jgi:hypothetical protein
MEHTAVNLIKTSYAPSSSWNLLSSHNVPYDLFAVVVEVAHISVTLGCCNCPLSQTGV